MTASAIPETEPHDRVPDGVIRRSDLVSAGISHHTLASRCRPSGKWQVLLPGVLLLANSPPNRRQRLKAAVLYAGPGSIITGVQALNEHGLLDEDEPGVHVLIGATRRVSTRDFVRVERTTRPPVPTLSHGLLFAPPARAAVDAARQARARVRQHELLFAPINAGVCTVEQIRVEVDAGSQRGTAALRDLLEDPVTSAAVTSTLHQGWAKRVIKESPLPPPEWNVPIFDGTTEIGIADAWWGEVGLAWDFGNQRDRRSRERQQAFAEAGLIMVHTPIPDLRGNPDAVVVELATAFAEAARRCRRAATS